MILAGEGGNGKNRWEKGFPKDRVPGTSGMGRAGCGRLSAQSSRMRKY